MICETLTPFLERPFDTTLQSNKEVALLPILKTLTHHHMQSCAAYAKIIALSFPDYEEATNLAELPYLPVSLFKHRRLNSVPESIHTLTVQSSGTSAKGQSQITLDKETAQATAQSLAAIIKDRISPSRLPMLIIDAPSTLKSGGALSARSAAILGLMPFGHAHCFALRDDLTLDEEKVSAFLSRYGAGNFLVYGFTFLVWDKLLPYCKNTNCDFSHATLIHSGGWKHLSTLAVDHDAFALAFAQTAKLKQIVNFYGMAEMPGVIYPDHGDGLLIPPAFSCVIIRDPQTLAPLSEGEIGLVQTFNPLATSFPGHSLLTEDLGSWHKTPHGLALRIHGRVPRAALRGCSDVIASMR
ncbi:MAG: acyl-protein synthetase [Alphaproteobacteria bacterium]|jgi:hypothetical protein|nr:acyl-protein synthetase [Alphaproteobacteria bacterium]